MRRRMPRRVKRRRNPWPTTADSINERFGKRPYVYVYMNGAWHPGTIKRLLSGPTRHTSMLVHALDGGGAWDLTAADIADGKVLTEDELNRLDPDAAGTPIGKAVPEQAWRRELAKLADYLAQQGMPEERTALQHMLQIGAPKDEVIKYLSLLANDVMAFHYGNVGEPEQRSEYEAIQARVLEVRSSIGGRHHNPTSESGGEPIPEEEGQVWWGNMTGPTRTATAAGAGLPRPASYAKKAWRSMDLLERMTIRRYLGRTGNPRRKNTQAGNPRRTDVRPWFQDLMVPELPPMLELAAFEAAYMPVRHSGSPFGGIKLNKRGRSVVSTPGSRKGAQTRHDNEVAAAYDRYVRDYEHAAWQQAEARNKTKRMFNPRRKNTRARRPRQGPSTRLRAGNPARHMEVAEIIRRQIGGRALFMMGAKDLAGSNDGLGALRFKVGRGALRGITHIQVQLDPSDTYTVKFLKYKRGGTTETVDEYNDVYVEDLRRIISSTTGFALSL